jgi:CHRD domain
MPHFSTKTVSAAAAIAALFAASAPCLAETVNLTATLKGAEETPPNDTTGIGSLKGTYDTETKKLTWSVSYSGLTGPATAAHFHGPAGPGKAAPAEVPATGVDKNPIVGSATLTEGQAKDLLDGNLYFNIHTAANKAGEIRGQVGK